MLRPAGADRSDLRPGADRGGSMTATTPTVQEQASAVLVHAAGYASHRTIAIGLRSGLLEALAASEHTTPRGVGRAARHGPVLRVGVVPGRLRGRGLGPGRRGGRGGRDQWH